PARSGRAEDRSRRPRAPWGGGAWRRRRGGARASLRSLWHSVEVPTPTLVLMLSLLAAGPARPADATRAETGARPSGERLAPAAEGPAATAAAPEDGLEDDYVEQAPLDVETLLTGSSRAYLRARARLEEHPELAADAILDRLATVPPPT